MKTKTEQQYKDSSISFAIALTVLAFLTITQTPFVKAIPTPMLFVYSLCGISALIGIYFIVKYIKSFLMELINDWKA